MTQNEPLKHTALYDLHLNARAKMVAFAGYEMPVSYPDGIIKEHLHTRGKAGLFDVSHMGQITVSGQNAALLLESLMPIDIAALGIGKQRYGLLINDKGGVIDDLMVTRMGENDFIIVVNAACKHNDFKHLQDSLENQLTLEMADDKSLLALQGPKAAEVMENLGQNLSGMSFMDTREMDIKGVSCVVSRSGYTGEDGFEISVADDDAATLAETLLADNNVKWVGLGARDSLRLEAGLCLYGHDITEHTTPIEANLLWAISKSRRGDGERAGGFPGDHIILPQIPKNVSHLLVAFKPEGRAPIREGAVIEDLDGNTIGEITSGGFSPSLGHPICIGYVDIGQHTENNHLNAVVRGKKLAMHVTHLPFVPRRYYRAA